jgi:hypothetical protein
MRVPPRRWAGCSFFIGMDDYAGEKPKAGEETT